METLHIEVPGASYPVHIGPGLIQDPAVWPEALPPGKILIVSDATVAELYLDKLARSLGDRHPELLILPSGEEQKSFESWRAIIDRLIAGEALRDASLVALGGGVIGDLTGFAAATYMRGIRFVQVPTTLLAQVDASVGGKTAVNHPAGKNLIGAFHQPSAVMIDSDTLSTLPEREYRAGLAEVVKYGIIRDAAFFDWLEAHVNNVGSRESEATLEVIARSVRNKAEVVAEDEKEQGIRATLNFGHTFAHALETLTGYSRYLHGEAVAIGMVVATALSEQRGICGENRTSRVRGLLNLFGLPVSWPSDIDPERAYKAMAMDKKALNTGLRLVLIEEIGKAVVDRESTSRDIVRAIESQMDASQP